MAETRECPRCCEELAAECFYNTGGYCKDCTKVYNKIYRKRKRQADSDSEDEPPSEAAPGAEAAPDAAPGAEAAPDAAPEAPETSPHAQDLYIFSNSLLPGILKIGRSKNVERRRVEMQRSQPFHINTVATFPGKGHLEGIIHTTLHASLVDGPGREWFRVSASDAIHTIAIAMRGSNV
jgi:hypothetical protein